MYVNNYPLSAVEEAASLRSSHMYLTSVVVEIAVHRAERRRGEPGPDSSSDNAAAGRPAREPGPPIRRCPRVTDFLSISFHLGTIDLAPYIIPVQNISTQINENASDKTE